MPYLNVYLNPNFDAFDSRTWTEKEKERAARDKHGLIVAWAQRQLIRDKQHFMKYAGDTRNRAYAEETLRSVLASLGSSEARCAFVELTTTGHASHPSCDPDTLDRGVQLHINAPGPLAALHEFAHHFHMDQRGTQSPAPGGNEHGPHGYVFVHHFHRLLTAYDPATAAAFFVHYQGGHRGITGTGAPRLSTIEAYGTG